MRILVVEDEKKVASFVKRGLEEEGFIVEIAQDEVEGIRLAETGTYDLILIDVIPPPKDGLSIIHELHQKKLPPPLLCLTEKVAVADIAAALDTKSDDYLTKPFVFADLVARVRGLIRRGTQERGAELYFADLRLDPISHKVWRNSQEIDLTTKEYALIKFFLRNPNQILTRTMIAEHVWDYTFDSFTDIIDVYVNYLRKKIDHNFEKKLIHTAPGLGYVLKESD